MQTTIFFTLFAIFFATTFSYVESNPHLTNFFLTPNRFVREQYYDKKEKFEASQSDSSTTENPKDDDMWQHFPEGNSYFSIRGHSLTTWTR